MHRRPEPHFYRRHGRYYPKCRPWPIPRFRCKSCRRTFSRQTFRMDYRDHRPDLNEALFKSLSTGVGLRQTARNIGLSLRCTELKARKIARHLRHLNLNLRGALPDPAILQLDEFESFEGRRNTRPVTIPMLIERDSRFIIWAESASIRPRGKMTDKRRKAIELEEERFGPRRDDSRRALLRTLLRGRRLARSSELVILQTDEKSTYPKLAGDVFKDQPLHHARTNSRLVRDTFNPLFPINSAEAMVRDMMGRLRRESWLVSKQRRYLDLALVMFMSYRNYVRRRFNRDDFSAAQALGFVPRRLRGRELLTWRQDWGRESIHPIARRSESVADFRRSA